MTTKELCCSTVGEGWGESCESCSTLESQCGPGLLINDLQECTGECMRRNGCCQGFIMYAALFIE